MRKLIIAAILCLLPIFPVVAQGINGIASPRKVFSYETLDWNAYRFEAMVPESPDYRFEWDLGDGRTSNRHTIEHTYTQPGKYTVFLKTIEADGTTVSDSINLEVRFFAFKNWMVQVMLGGLLLLLLVGIIVLVKTFRKKDPQMSQDENTTE